ncbi:hypothetical protein ES288_D04G175400v1 [Gossypium darwinii]|uniref:1,3-beta-glucan synthase n=1 Tax=Gossypium darwinii TaxID=34276 RepID=A0A5D2CYH3_GOSDA|nr:hypothetical protein ES288_D04G175400v1 [Gossypium darwinii]
MPYRYCPGSKSGRTQTTPPEDEPYNIIPVHNLRTDHPSLRFSEVRAVASALRAFGDLRLPPHGQWHPAMDLLDWLALFFCFQHDNFKNQREHLVLQLANSQMRLSLLPENIDTLDAGVLRTFRRKLLKNYTNWCSYLGKKSNVWISKSGHSNSDHRRELLYILEDYIDENTGQPVMPLLSGENAFLYCVVKLIYETVKAEVENSKNRTAPHTAWRNYDDLNDYFWSKRCFKKLKWPLDVGNKFFVTSSRSKHVGKTGFIEQRSFWNLYRSFERLWVMQFLFLQTAIIQALTSNDVRVKVLIAILDVGMQYSRVSRDTCGLGFRMVLKAVVAAGWIVTFPACYVRIWSQRSQYRRWSAEAGKRVVFFLLVAFVYVLPELLALVLFVLPWWFQSKSFVGRGLREGLVDNIKYTLFWVLVLATKFAFSYFLQTKPMIKPTKQLLGLNNVDYEWPGGSIKLAVGLLCIPVVFIYLMDIQIWYSIYSSFLGARVGLLQHLGEIKNIQQLKLRFQFFASAIPTFKNKFNDAISMLKLRYGLGQPYRKLESNQVEAQKFALGRRYLSLMLKAICWPCFLLCKELLVDAPDKWLWHKISKNEYRRCAVIEPYDSIKHMMLEILNARSEEYSVFAVLFHEIDHSIEIEKFTKTFKMTSLPQIHLKLIQLVEILTKPKKDASQVVYILQALYEIAVRDFFKDQRTIEQLREDGLAPRDPAAMAGLLFEKVVKLPDPNDEKFFRQVRRLHTILTSKDSMQNIPCPHPHYNEEVLYSKEQLRTENEDGISILYYLQTIYDDDWKNFMERIDLRLWASYRGQTLFRTIRGVIGMMYYYRALKMLAFLDSASEMDIREGIQELGSVGEDVSLDGFNSKVSPSSKSLGGASSSLNLLFKGHEKGASLMKFTYVVACQIYGAQKDKKDPHAKEILYLMKHNEALRVAYVDDVSVGRDEKEYYSVLVKYDQQLQKEVEIYHVQLPSPLKLGEGKPENQNHAIIFTRGDAVQTIDMNQENYFEETLKMRNLLEEYKSYYGIRKPTILGVREHIFTGSVSSLTWFMSAQETSFVTLGQRVLANPLKIRMHYGHPDIFNRFWVLTQGGISKVSRMVNISEDIFTGFNCTLRGGNVSHHEYIQVGKGRDVGLNQISMFETKVASENGEEVLSRDVYRLGFFVNTLMVILTVYAFLWGRLYLALSGIEIAALASNNNNNKALSAILNQQFIIQLGIFTALPMIVENSLEHGFLQAIWDFLTMQLQLSSVFYTFTMGTRTHFFGWTVLHGRPKYRGTGRGFVVQHKSFAENYRLYVRSHFIKAIEFGLILTIYASHNPDAKDTFVYIAMTISSWFLVLSWIMAPFVFNPSGFDWLKTVDDFDEFMNWIWYCGGVFAKAERSWERWWYEEQDHLRTTSLWGKILEIVLDLWFFFFQYGMIYIFVAFIIYMVISYARDKYAAKEHIYFQLVQFLVIVFGILVVIARLEFTSFKFIDILTSLLAFIPTGWGLISIAQALGVRCVCGSTSDILFGMIVMAPLACLSWMLGFQSMKTRILFNEAFSRGLQIFQIVTGKNLTDS